MDAKKPREFKLKWDDGRLCFKRGFLGDIVHAMKDGEEIRVIEKSAYDDQQAVIEEMNAAIQFAIVDAVCCEKSGELPQYVLSNEAFTKLQYALTSTSPQKGRETWPILSPLKVSDPTEPTPPAQSAKEEK